MILKTKKCDGVVWSGKLYRQTMKRAKKNNLAIDITPKYIQYLWKKHDGACSLTGIEFVETEELLNDRRPFIPSIDRKDRRKGYLKKNIRLVCVAVNMALFTWGVEVFDKVVRKRMELLNTPEKNRFIFEDQPDELISRGHAEIFLGLGSGWFAFMERAGKPTPPFVNRVKHGNNYHYKYSKKELINWFNEYSK